MAALEGVDIAFMTPEATRHLASEDAWNKLWTWTRSMVQLCVEKPMKTERSRGFKDRFMKWFARFFFEVSKLEDIFKRAEETPGFAKTLSWLWHSEQRTAEGTGPRLFPRTVASLVGRHVMLAGLEISEPITTPDRSMPTQFMRALASDGKTAQNIIRKRLLRSCHDGDYWDVKACLVIIFTLVQDGPTQQHFIHITFVESMAKAFRRLVTFYDPKKSTPHPVRESFTLCMSTLQCFMDLGPRFTETALHADLLDSLFAFVATIGFGNGRSRFTDIVPSMLKDAFTSTMDTILRFAPQYSVLKQLHRFVHDWEARIDDEIPKKNKEVWEAWSRTKKMTKERWDMARRLRRQPTLICQSPQVSVKFSNLAPGAGY